MMHFLSFTLLLAFAADANAAPPIVAVAFAPDGASVLAASQAGVQQLTWPDLAFLSSVESKLEQVHDLAFSPDGSALAIAGGSPGEFGAVEIWEWPAAKLRASFAAGDDLVYRAAWNNEGKTLALACANKTVRLQAVAGGPPQSIQAHSAAVLSVCWLPADDHVLSAGVDQSVRLLSAKSGETVRTFDNHTAAVRDVAVRPGQHNGPPLVASASADRTVRFWQPTIGRLLRFARLPSAPTDLCWTPDGTQVLAACEDGRLRAVDPMTVEVAELDPCLRGWAHAVAASLDGKHALLAGEHGELRRVSLDAIVGNALRGVP